jgi:16S rRNA processing protein RimM
VEPEDRIQIGVVGKPHGVRGGFFLDGCIDAPALVAGRTIWIAGTARSVASRRGTEGRPILLLEGVDSREEIASLRGESVQMARGDMTSLAEGEWLAVDLVGLLVTDRGGRELGKIARLTNLPSVDVLEVRPEEGEPLLVPMVRDAIVSIDPDHGVTVDETFLDLG